MKASSAKVQEINIKPIARADVVVNVRGLTTMIQNKFADAAKKKMLDKQMGLSGPKELRKIDPEVEAKGHTHYLSDGKSVGYPADAFTNAIATAASIEGLFLKDVSHVTVMPEDGNLVEIKYKNRVVQEDTVTLANGSPDVIHRPYFYDWSCKLKIMYDANRITLEKLVALVNRAGYDVGIGAWRPYVKGGKGKPGWHGRFEAVTNGGKK